MRELLVRTLSGVVLVAVIIGALLFSPWTCAALALFIVVMGTYEMSRLQRIESKGHLVLGELMAVGAFLVIALYALNVKSLWVAVLLFPLFPFLMALFSKTRDFKSIAAFTFGSMAYLSLPCALMVYMDQRFGPK